MEKFHSCAQEFSVILLYSALILYVCDLGIKYSDCRFSQLLHLPFAHSVLLVVPTELEFEPVAPYSF